MAMPLITCLMVKNMSLTDEARDALYLTALDMVRDKKKRQRISGCEFEGEIRTEFKPAHLATVDGFLFEATIDIGSRTGTIRFIVPSEYYEGMEKVTWIAVTADHTSSVRSNKKPDKYSVN